MSFKIGIGYDVHKLVEARKLIIGGVNIPFDKGLEGHSDADVLLHAICDAILGALGKGDIGEHFPPTDEEYKDISSLVLLGKVDSIMKQEGFNIGNIDTVIHAQEPNLKKYKKDMQSRIAECLGMQEERINIKATTHEGLGALGRKEGIAATAIVLLNKD